MSFKKLKTEVVEALKHVEITTFNEELQSYFSAIRSGKHVFISAPENTGKSTLALVSIFNKVNQEFEGSPRAIYLTNSIENAEKFHTKTSIVCRKLDITSDLVHDKGNKIQQRNNIFDGTEIIVGNPKRVTELYLQNGINLKLLDLFIVDNLDDCLNSNYQAELKRLIESLERKTQIILLTNSTTKKVETFVYSLELPITSLESNN